MVESFVQVAPDSTGKQLRTRTKVIGSNTVHEQYVYPVGERLVGGAAVASSFRIPARAVSTQTLVTGMVASGATSLIAIRRIAVEVDSIVAKAVFSPWLRLRRITATAGGGSLTPVLLDTGETLNATGLLLYQDVSADATLSSTALSSTGMGADLWQQVLPRFNSAIGMWNPNALSLLPDDGGFTNDNPFIVRPGTGFQVRVDSPTAMTAGDWNFGVKIAFEEFTLP